jgi:hypothetical protein
MMYLIQVHTAIGFFSDYLILPWWMSNKYQISWSVSISFT